MSTHSFTLSLYLSNSLHYELKDIGINANLNQKSNLQTLTLKLLQASQHWH